MRRFWKFLVIYSFFLLILSYIYTVFIYMGMFEVMDALAPKNMKVFSGLISEFLGAAIIPSLFVSVALILITTHLLRKVIEKSRKFTVRNGLQMIGIYYLYTTLVFIFQFALFYLTESHPFLALLNAGSSIDEYGWFVFPIAWILLLVYLLQKFKLTGKADEAVTP